MTIIKTATGLIIKEPTIEIKRKILQYFSLSRPTREYFIYSGNDVTRKPLFGKEHDVIYITSGILGVKDSVLQKELSKYSTITPPQGKRIDIKMSREPRSDLQRDCIDLMTTSTSNKITIELRPGVGKAEPYSRKIPSPSATGYTLMGDLKLGDDIFDAHGNITKVISIFEQGERDVYRLTFQDGRTAYCAKEHLWMVKNHKNGAWKTIMLKDMLEGFVDSQQGKSLKYYIPKCCPVNYNKQDVPLDPWVLGCFIGNGCCTSNQLAIASENDEVPNKIADICGFTVEKNKANYCYYFYEKGEPIQTKDFFKEIPCMIGTYSRDKKIPISYMVNDVDTRLRILQGLMDTNGSISCNHDKYYIKYSSASKVLLKQVKQLLYSFGYSGIISNRFDKKYTNDFCGSVIFKVPPTVNTHFFTIASKVLSVSAIEAWQDDCDDLLLITDISFSHREKCRCLMVDNHEHLYLTEDYIVTHNTFISLYAIAKLSLKALIVVPTTLLKNQWVEELMDSGIDRNDIAIDIYDAPNKKMCVVTMTSIEDKLRDDWEGLLNVINNSCFGIKITDESHLHLKGLLKLDAICNIKHNWYLSATLGRSDISEDSILNRALSDAERFVGNSKYIEYQKEYVNIYLQDIYYNPSAKLCDEYFRYGSKGLIRSTYYNMLMEYQNGVPFLNNIIRVTKTARSIVPYEAKTLILTPLIRTCKTVIELMKNDPYFSKLSCVSIDGSMSMSEKRKALESDIIVSTTMSIGTGVDIQNLGSIVNFDQYSSPITNEQVIGRARDRGKEVYYIDICDHVKYAKSFQIWGNKRRMIMQYFPGVSDQFKQLPDIHC